MSYKSLTIYYNSGTGNSRRVANWVAETAKSKNLQATVSPYEVSKPKEEIVDGSDNLIALVMPTHAFTAPWSMIKFACRLPRIKSTAAIALATRAGWKLGPFFLPGLSGTNTYLVSLLLWLKGYKPKGIFCVDMPSNWIAFHWGLAPKNVAHIITEAKPKVEKFAGNILEEKTHWLSPNNIYELIFGLALSLISFMYLILGRLYLTKIFFASNKCNFCGICVKNCPTGALRFPSGEKKLPFWTFHCESCMRCMAFCPEKAIGASHSWLIALIFLVSGSTAAYFFARVGRLIPGLDSVYNSGSKTYINFLYTYCVIFLSYYLFYLLLKIPFINKFFQYTTFTSLWRHYREPGTKVGDFFQA